MTAPSRITGYSLPLAGSPVAVLRDAIDQALGAGTIPLACPHPVGELCLDMPERDLACADCLSGLRAARAARGEQARCASCGGAASGGSVWPGGEVRVCVSLCEPCKGAGNVSQSLN